MIQPEPEGSTQGYPLVSVEVLSYDKRSKSENIGIVPTEMSILTDSYVTLSKHRQMTKPYSSHHFIANRFNARHLKMVVKVPVSSCLKEFIAVCSYPTIEYKDIMKAQVYVSRLLLL
nr:hypothetical protein [Tanacetum cinerariifolium]